MNKLGQLRGPARRRPPPRLRAGGQRADHSRTSPAAQVADRPARHHRDPTRGPPQQSFSGGEPPCQQQRGADVRQRHPGPAGQEVDSRGAVSRARGPGREAVMGVRPGLRRHGHGECQMQAGLDAGHQTRDTPRRHPPGGVAPAHAGREGTTAGGHGRARQLTAGRHVRENGESDRQPGHRRGTHTPPDRCRRPAHKISILATKGNVTQLIARTMRAAHDAAVAIACRPRKDARQAQPGQAWWPTTRAAAMR